MEPTAEPCDGGDDVSRAEAKSSGREAGPPEPGAAAARMEEKMGAAVVVLTEPEDAAASWVEVGRLVTEISSQWG